MRTLITLTVALAAGCVSGTGIRPAPAAPEIAMLDQDVARRGAVPWSDDLLSWEDFKGPAPERRGNRAAETAYTILHAAQCTGTRFEFRVIAAMLPDQSWVAANVRQDPALAPRTLRHEQTHFDLAEVHARRLRRHFSGLYNPCGRSTGDLDTLAGQFMREETEAQLRYDDETSHGRLDQPQRGWDADVARQLLALEAFGDRARRPPAQLFRMRPEM